jgi:hypothetical protein
MPVPGTFRKALCSFGGPCRSRGGCFDHGMDRMIGDQFEKGLAAMKTAAEAAPRS